MGLVKMFLRRRCALVLGGGVLCLLCCVSMLLQPRQQSLQLVSEALQFHPSPKPPLDPADQQDKVGVGGEEEPGGVAVEKQQVRRHLLDTVGTPMHVTNPHISFIRLEGVDSSGNDMFLVHGATVEQLKGVCAALEECEGFNSEGWIKSRVAGKKRSTIDLYLKQVARLEEGEELELEEGAGLFGSLMHEYNKMEAELKIYMYETSVGEDIPSRDDYKYGVEQLFISLLAKSKFRTKVAEEATLFFLPSRCTAYRKSVAPLEEGVVKAAAVTRDMLADVRTRFPYWNQTLGADHFYICAHDMGTEVTHLADSALQKNAIGLVNTADYSEPYFVPHKDISLPMHPGRGTISWAQIGQGGATFDPYRRTKLAFLAGNAKRGVRPQIYRQYRSDPDFHMVPGHMTEQDYMKALKSSKFCLCPRGNKGWSPRVMDALWFGCIPVFLADHYVPPLYDIIPWDAISVAVPESQVSSLKDILQSFSFQRIAAMQQNILKVYHHLTWHDSPQPYDAFHAVLFQLWRRRHVRRTKPLPLPYRGVLR